MAAMSGITVDEEVTEVYRVVKKNNSTKKYMIMRISDDLKCVILENCPDDDTPIAERGEEHMTQTVTQFVNEMKQHVNDHPHHCCYGVIVAGTGPNSKVRLVSLVPDTSTVKMKMLYGPTALTVKGALTGVQTHMPLSDPADLSVKALLSFEG